MGRTGIARGFHFHFPGAETAGDRPGFPEDKLPPFRAPLAHRSKPVAEDQSGAHGSAVVRPRARREGEGAFRAGGRELMEAATCWRSLRRGAAGWLCSAADRWSLSGPMLGPWLARKGGQSRELQLGQARWPDAAPH